MTRAPLLATCFAALLISGAALGHAEETLVIGGEGSSVIVDLSTLDGLGGKPKPKPPKKTPAAKPAPAKPTVAAPPAPAKPTVAALPAPVTAPAKVTPPPAQTGSPSAATMNSPAAQTPASAEAGSSPVMPEGLAPAARLRFASGAEDMDEAAIALVDALVSENGSGARVIQVRAYAAGSSETNSAARRLSLKRAVAVRTYMIHKGMQAARIDVRALGPAPDAGPADRVDIVIMP